MRARPEDVIELRLSRRTASKGRAHEISAGWPMHHDRRRLATCRAILGCRHGLQTWAADMGYRHVDRRVGVSPAESARRACLGAAASYQSGYWWFSRRWLLLSWRRAHGTTCATPLAACSLCQDCACAPAASSPGSCFTGASLGSKRPANAACAETLVSCV